VCDSIATYGKGEGEAGVPGMAGGMASGGDGHSHGGMGEGKDVEHITSMSACFDDKLGVRQLKKGQKWQLEAFYDYNKYAPDSSIWNRTMLTDSLGTQE
jgi:hypothetical protein